MELDLPWRAKKIDTQRTERSRGRERPAQCKVGASLPTRREEAGREGPEYGALLPPHSRGLSRGPAGLHFTIPPALRVGALLEML